MADLKQLKLPKQISNTLNSVNKTISENKDLKINVNSNIVLEKDDTLNLPSISNISTMKICEVQQTPLH